MKTIRKITVIATVCCLLLVAAGCSIAKVANLAKCQFSMANVSDITWAGINLSQINGVSDLSIENLKKAGTALKNKDFNVSCNVNVNVKNDTKHPAKLFAFDYELFLENALLATGSSKGKVYDINPASTTVIPVPVHVNIADVVQKGEVGNIINFARNLMDYGSGKESNIKVRLTPYVGSQSTKLPAITLNKTFQ